jgi:hypothetical protein
MCDCVRASLSKDGGVKLWVMMEELCEEETKAEAKGMKDVRVGKE